MDSGKPLPVEPSAPGRDHAGNNSSPPDGPHPLVGPIVPANEECALAVEEVLLVLVAEPQAPTWARHIVHFLQTGELPDDQHCRITGSDKPLRVEHLGAHKDLSP